MLSIDMHCGRRQPASWQAYLACLSWQQQQIDANVAPSVQSAARRLDGMGYSMYTLPVVHGLYKQPCFCRSGRCT